MSNATNRATYYPIGLLPPFPVTPPRNTPPGYHPYPFCRGDYTKYCPDPYYCSYGSVWLQEAAFIQLHCRAHDGCYTLPDIDQRIRPFLENQHPDYLISGSEYYAQRPKAYAASAYPASTAWPSAPLPLSQGTVYPSPQLVQNIQPDHQQGATANHPPLLLTRPVYTAAAHMQSGELSRSTTTDIAAVTVPATSNTATPAVLSTSKDASGLEIYESTANDAVRIAPTSDGSLPSDITCKWGTCYLVFPTQQSALEHIKSDHIGSRKKLQYDFTCRIRECSCGGKVFEKRDNVVSHITNVAFDIRYAICPFKKDGCKIALKREWDLPRHKKICRFNPENDRKKRQKIEEE
ncbi:hypothetical protein ABW21_db0203402 [Orbilia brochopaga]|nr:hypothetical protein ABW21_db0203402 [Drechslerella brochopaga]